MSGSLHVKNICKELFKAPGYLQDGDVVELVGAQSTGKSSVLQELMIRCLVPSSCGGCGCGVFYFDLDFHFDLLNTVAIMQQKTAASEEDIKLWLKNLHVVRCNSMEQVVISLHALESLLAKSKVPFGMIILDSISSFYWVDQRDGSNHRDKEKNMQKIVEVLKKLKEQFRLCVLASCQSLVQSDNKQSSCVNEVSYKPFLSQYWQNFVNYRFLLSCNEDSLMQTYTAHSLTHKSFNINFAINEYGVKFLSEL